MMDFATLKLDGIETPALEKAKQGDLAPLLALLRSDRPLNDLERKFIADRLEGKPQGRAKPGRKAKLQILDDFVLDDFLMLTEFYGHNATDAQDIIAGYIGCVDKNGKDNGNVRQRIKRASEHRSGALILSKQWFYQSWRKGHLDLKAGEVFEDEGETFVMPEKPSLFCESRSREEIKKLKRPYK